MSEPRHGNVLALVPIALAVVLHGYEQAFESANGFAPGVFLWSLLPYGFCGFALAKWGQAVPIALAAAAALLLDAFAHYRVFIHPSGSTSLVLLFMPLWNTLVTVPVVGGLAHLGQRWMEQRRRRNIE